VAAVSSYDESTACSHFTVGTSLNYTLWPGLCFTRTTGRPQSLLCAWLPLALAALHLIFAGLTEGMVAGAAADRMKFGAWLVLASIWAALVYFPVAHWVFAFDSGAGACLGQVR
jgi:ammonia channel protein AmtB